VNALSPKKLGQERLLTRTGLKDKGQTGVKGIKKTLPYIVTRGGVLFGSLKSCTYLSRGWEEKTTSEKKLHGKPVVKQQGQQKRDRDGRETQRQQCNGEMETWKKP